LVNYSDYAESHGQQNIKIYNRGLQAIIFQFLEIHVAWNWLLKTSFFSVRAISVILLS